jgi:hypothetical protein
MLRSDSFAAHRSPMRSPSVLSVCLLAGSTAAQITIGPNDMPSAGDTVRYVNTVADGVDLDLTGAGVVWDLSWLEPGMEGADTVVGVNSTPVLYQFYFNNPFIYPDHDADIAMRGRAFSFQQLNVSNVFEYFKRDASGYRNVGFGANVNGVPTSVRRIPVDQIHVFPLNFGDTDQSFSSFSLEVPTLFSFTQDQVRTNTVDGWGTLYLPADTFEVLRVRSVLQRDDSVFIAQFGQGFAFSEPETVEYKWIANGMDEPVLLVTTVGGEVSEARFHYSPEEVQTGLGDLGAVDMALYPNPANSTVWLRTAPGSANELYVVDALGRRVIVAQRLSPSGIAAIDVSGLAGGRYQVHVNGPDRRILPLVVQP